MEGGIRISPDILKRVENKEIPTLNDSGYLLLELPFYVMSPNVENLIFNLRQRKVIPIIGRDIRKASFSMIEKDLVDFVATDAHNLKMRPPILSRAYKEVKGEFDEEIADRLFFHNPGKIVEGLKKEASTMRNEEINGLP